MRLFLDTADVEEVRTGVGWGVVSGVTTNPTLVSRSGREFLDIVRELCRIVPGPVNAEVLATDTEGMLREAETLRAIGDSVVVKIPMTPQGLTAVRELSRRGIPTNVTLVFSANQALLAAAAGATYVSPFVGRVDDVGGDGIALVREIAEIFAVQDIQTQVLAASLRHPQHVTAAALAGADIATMPFAVLRQMFEHPLTERGLERFLRDAASLSIP
ncbi:MAG: fructose-6-phosphate aldolase [Clostridia bacterium]|nr:fructose-6-phosphate aldolase [Clostridia bacterium]